ncbi:MAG: HD domain-containing protein [Lachnospiraceae bacterium]|nr:HD domain-containing protein [Lachnospiraceae bacterium]
MDRLKQQMEFMQEIDKLKNIGRQSYITDGKKKENDAEHSWHLAMMAMLLSEYSNEKIDVLRVMSMVLIHDLVEIDAGDTYAYDTEGNKTKRLREEKAADRIFNILPKDQAKYIRELWEEFEEGKTNEARFALALDRIQPIMLNATSGGRAWEEHHVQLSQILERNKKVEEGSVDLWKFAKEAYIEPNVLNGKIGSNGLGVSAHKIKRYVKD